MINFETLRLWCMAVLFVIVGLLTPTVSLAQDKTDKADKADKADVKIKTDEFCNNWSDGDRHNVNEVREFTVASSGTVTVDGGTNGGVSVTGENRSDVLIRACVQAQAKTEEDARAVAKSVTINTNGTISANGQSGNQSWYSVSYRIYVPHNTNLKLTTHNGGIKISGVNGSMEFEALNGGIKLSDIAGSVKGKTSNGGVKVDLSGKSWNGPGLDVQTTNGGVQLTLPEDYSAKIETGTVNGGFKSDIAAIAPPPADNNQRGYVRRATRVNATLNGGGAPIRVMTTNGGVKINSSSNDK